MVTKTFSAILEEKERPLSRVTRMLGPRMAAAAVAPKQMTVFGCTICSSASSHGRQAAISLGDGFLWRRRFPTGVHLKCLTALVT